MGIRVVSLIAVILFAPSTSAWFVPIKDTRFAADRDLSVQIESDGDGGVVIVSNVGSADGLNPAPLTVLRLAADGDEMWRSVLLESQGEPVTAGWVQGLIVDQAHRAVYLSALLFRSEPLVFFATIAKLGIDTGTVQWQRRIQRADAGTHQSLPIAIAPSGDIFTAYVDRLSRTVFVERLDGDSGSSNWQQDQGDARLWVGVTADDEGNAIVASEYGGLSYAVKVNGLDGSAIWRYQDQSTGVPRVHASREVYYAGSGVTRRAPLLTKLEPASGRPVWHATLDVDDYFPAETLELAVTPTGTPVAAGRFVREIAGDRFETRFGVTAFDAESGSQRWNYLLPEGSTSRDIAADQHGNILIAGNSNNGLGTGRDFFVAKVDQATGEAVWQYSVPSLGGGFAEHIAAVSGAAVATGPITNRTADCGDNTDLVAIKLRDDNGQLFSERVSPTPRPQGVCTDHILYVTTTNDRRGPDTSAQGRLALIDGKTLDPLGLIEVGERPTQIVVSPNRPTAYVVDPGDLWWTQGSGTGRVFEIDIPSREVAGELRVRTGAQSIAITGNGEKLYVANLGSGSVSVLTTDPLEPLGTIEGIDAPAALASNDHRNEVYVATATGSLLVIDTQSDSVSGDVRIAESAHSVSVAPDGQTILVSGDYPERSIFFVDASTLAVVGEACCSTALDGAGALAIAEDGATAILAHDDTNPVLLDTESGLFDPVEVDCSAAVSDQLRWNEVGSVAVRGTRGYAGPYAVDLVSGTVIDQIEPNDLRGRPLGVAVGPCVAGLEGRSASEDDGCQVGRPATTNGSWILLLVGISLALNNRYRLPGTCAPQRSNTNQRV